MLWQSKDDTYEVSMKRSILRDLNEVYFVINGIVERATNVQNYVIYVFYGRISLQL